MIISAAALLVIGLTITVIVLSKNDEQSQDENDFLDEKQKENDPIEQPIVIDDGKIHPTYNVEAELDNPLSQLKGRMLYAKRESQGGLGYANVRSSAAVDTGGWDLISNKITTIKSGTPIGKVVSEEAAEINSYAYRWFYVKLYKPISGWWSDYTHGYVRADTVTFKPYEQ